MTDTEKWKAKARELCEQLIDGYTEYDVDHVAAVLAGAAADERDWCRRTIASAADAGIISFAVYEQLATAIRARGQKP